MTLSQGSLGYVTATKNLKMLVIYFLFVLCTHLGWLGTQVDKAATISHAGSDYGEFCPSTYMLWPRGDAHDPPSSSLTRTCHTVPTSPGARNAGLTVPGQRASVTTATDIASLPVPIQRRSSQEVKKVVLLLLS